MLPSRLTSEIVAVATEPRLVCLAGAECTGKTTLAQALATHLCGLWVPEYLRIFCERQGHTPKREEQPHILQEQVRQEQQALESAQHLGLAWVFCDTAPLLTAIYSDCLFDDAKLYAQARALHGRYALTLVLEPDIPWVADGILRDGAQARAVVHARLVQTLAAWGVPYTRIGGQGAQRQRAALEILTAVPDKNNGAAAHVLPTVPPPGGWR